MRFPRRLFYLTIICHPLVRRFMYEDVESPPLLEKLNRLIDIPSADRYFMIKF